MQTPPEKSPPGRSYDVMTCCSISFQLLVSLIVVILSFTFFGYDATRFGAPSLSSVPNWMREMSSTDTLHISKIFMNRDNRLLAAGSFSGTLTVDKRHVFTTDNGTNTDGVVLKLTPYLNSTDWVYHIFGQGSTSITMKGITGDINSNTYAVGCYVGSIHKLAAVTSQQLLIAKFSQTGSLLWIKTSEQIGKGEVCAVAVTAGNGLLFVSGTYTQSFSYDGQVISTALSSSVFALNIDSRDGSLQAFASIDKYYGSDSLYIDATSMVISTLSGKNYLSANTLPTEPLKRSIIMSIDSDCTPDWFIEGSCDSGSLYFWDNALLSGRETVAVVASYQSDHGLNMTYHNEKSQPQTSLSLPPSKDTQILLFLYDVTSNRPFNRSMHYVTLSSNTNNVIRLSLTANQNNNLYVSGQALSPIKFGPKCEYNRPGRLVAFVMVFDDDLTLHYCKWVGLNGNSTSHDTAHSSETFYAYQYLYLMYNNVMHSQLFNYKVEPGINPEFISFTLVYLICLISPAVVLCGMWQLRRLVYSYAEKQRERSVSLPETTNLLEQDQLSNTNYDAADIDIKPKMSACFSGGGIRSASVALGVLKELHNQGVLKDVQYIAGVSGGNYTTSAFISHLNAHYNKENMYTEALTGLEDQMEENCNFLASSTWRALRTVSALFMAISYSILNFVCLSLLLCEVLVGISAILDRIPVSKFAPGLGAQIKVLKFDIISGNFTTSAFYQDMTRTLIIMSVWAAVLVVLVVAVHFYDSVCHAISRMCCRRFSQPISDTLLSKVAIVIIGGLAIVVSFPVGLEILKSFMFIHGRMLLILYHKFGGPNGLFFIQIPIAIGYMALSFAIIIACYTIVKNPTISLSVLGFFGATVPCILIMSSVFFYRNVYVLLGAGDTSTTFASWIPVIATAILILLQVFYPFCHGALHITYRSRIVESFYHNSTDIKFSDIHPQMKPVLLSVVTVNNMKSSKITDRAHPMTFSSEGVECDDIGFLQRSGTDHFLGLVASLSGAAISIHLGNMDRLSSFNFRFFLVLFSATLGSWYSLTPKNKGFYATTILFFITYSSSVLYIMLQQRKLFLWNVSVFENIGYCLMIALLLISPFAIWFLFYLTKTPSYIMGLPFIRTMLHLLKIKQRKYDPLVYLSDGAHSDLLGLYPLLVKRQTVILVFDASDDKENTRMGLLQALARAEQTSLISKIGWDSISDEDKNEKSWCIVKFTYSDGQEGKIIYKQTRIDSNSDYYLQLYQRQNPSYPYHSLINQFYGQEEFRIYKKLGEDCVKGISEELAMFKNLPSS